MLRRPLFFSAAGLLSAVLSGHHLGIPATCIIASVIAVFLLIKGTGSSYIRKAMVLFTVSFVTGIFAYNVSSHSLAEAADYFCSGNGAGTYSGTVRDVEVKKNEKGERHAKAVIACEKGRLLVNIYELENGMLRDIVPGVGLKITGKPELPQERRNPGSFDYRLYLKSIKVSATMNAENACITDSRCGITGWLYKFSRAYVNKVREETDSRTAALVRAIMFGDKGELDTDILESFKKTGTAHILAVSGLHMGIIYSFIGALWRRKKGYGFMCFTGLFFAAYSVIAGLAPSVVRAVLMIMLHSFASATGRRYDLANSGFAVFAAAVLLNPFMAFNVGFQMSFLAVLTLTLVLPYIKSIYSGCFSASLAIQMGLGPYMLWNFNYLSMITVFINVPVIALAGIIVPLGLISMLPMAPAILFHAESGLCSILAWLCRTAEIDRLTTFQVASPPLWMMAVYYLGITAFATEEGRLAIIRRGRNYVIRAAAAVVIASSVFCISAGDGFENCGLTFVDVGQGDCLCIKCDDGIPGIGAKAFLVDGGGNERYNLGKQTLKTFLLRNGMSRVEGAFVTHLHTDHYKGICELAREGMVKQLYVYEGYRSREKNIMEETGLPGNRIRYLSAGDVIDIGNTGRFNGNNDVQINVLWPERKTAHEYGKISEEDENSMSLVMKAVFRNSSEDGEGKFTSVLTTGDMDEKGEELVTGEEKLRSDILKVGHHGSRYSSCDRFLDAVDAEYAVIQVGKNQSTRFMIQG